MDMLLVKVGNELQTALTRLERAAAPHAPDSEKELALNIVRESCEHVIETIDENHQDDPDSFDWGA